MKKTYQHRPGLFGLASIAAGCAAKNREVGSQGDSTGARGHRQLQTESRSEPGKSKIPNQSSGAEVTLGSKVHAYATVRESTG
jgi:hypothetical protein